MDNPSFFSVAHSLGCIFTFIVSHEHSESPLRRKDIRGQTHSLEQSTHRSDDTPKEATHVLNSKPTRMFLSLSAMYFINIIHSIFRNLLSSTEYEGHRVSINGHNPLPLACMCMQCRSYLARGSAISSTPPIVVTPLSFLFIYSLH